MSSVLLIFLVLCVVLLCVFTFVGPCCDIHYNFRIKTMFGSSLPSAVLYEGSSLYLRYLCLFAYSGVRRILWCCGFFLVFFGFFVFCLRLVSCVPNVASFSELFLRFSLTFISF